MLEYAPRIYSVLYHPHLVFCPGGEIGRHKGLKIPRLYGCTGSIPVPGTNWLIQRSLFHMFAGSRTWLLYKVILVIPIWGIAMIVRTNKVIEAAVNKGIAVAKFKDAQEAIKLMIRAGVPKEVIERVLNENHRSTDWS